MMDAFATIISNNLNAVMIFLASVTIILSAPTLVASIYGMNINLPLEKFEHTFLILMAAMLIITMAIIVLFRKLDWL